MAIFFIGMEYIIDIKEFRETNNLRQNDLADYLGLSQTFLSQIESGKRPLAQKHIRKLLEAGKFVTTMIKEKPLSVKQEQVSMDREVFDLLKNQSETILSQQRTIEMLAGKGEGAQPAGRAGCADVG